MHVIHYSTLSKKAAAWYDKPFVITIRKSTIVIWVLLLVILWLLVRPVHAQPKYSTINVGSARSQSTAKAPTTIPLVIRTDLQDKGGFSNAPIKKVEEVQKQIDDKKVAAQAVVDAQNAAEAARVAQEAQAVIEATPAPAPTTTPVQASVNLYDWGNCTFFVASKKPVPSTWGNANEWYGNAQAQGYSVGLVPQAGAIGVDFGGAYGHVFIVDAVYGDGTMLIEEMNYQGLGIVDQRVMPSLGIGFIYL